MEQTVLPSRPPIRAEDEVFPRDPFEPRRVLLERQANQVEYAVARSAELGLATMGAFLRLLLAQEMERRNG